ncbi:helix-turn-helix domain-containing protein [Fusibacter bizertensis]
MFSSYNMQLFGKKLKDIRSNLHLTQVKVSKLTGINVDAIRKIEKGSVVPKLETLELLTFVYKYNLLDLLNQYKDDYKLLEYYRKLDDAIVNSNNDRVITISEIVNEILNIDNIELINRNELSQLKIFAQQTKNYYCRNIEDYNIVIDELKKAIILTNCNFELDKLSDSVYSLFEIRILILIGLYSSRFKKNDDAIKIFRYCLDYLLIKEQANDEWLRISIIKLYYNLSYEYYLIQNDLKSYQYAKLGSEFCLKHKTHYLLALIYFRLGTAQYYLSDKAYKDTYSRAVALSYGLSDLEMVEYLSQKLEFESSLSSILWEVQKKSGSEK